MSVWTNARFETYNGFLRLGMKNSNHHNLEVDVMRMAVYRNSLIFFFMGGAPDCWADGVLEKWGSDPSFQKMLRKLRSSRTYAGSSSDDGACTQPASQEGSAEIDPSLLTANAKRFDSEFKIDWDTSAAVLVVRKLKVSSWTGASLLLLA